MKKVISVFLAVISLLLTPVTVLAESDGRSAPAMCYQVELNFVDELGYENSIAPTFMVPADKSTVYVKAEDILEFLNANYFQFKREQTYNQFAITCAALNYAVIYEFDSKNVYAYIAGSKIKYKAPVEAIYRDGVTWIPFEFTMKLFNIDYVCKDNSLKLGHPQYSALMVLAAVYGKESYSFSWVDEIGISALNQLTLSASSSLVTSLSNLLFLKGAAWADLLTLNLTHATEKEYAERVASLFVSPSTEEVESLSNSIGFLFWDTLVSILSTSNDSATQLSDYFKAQTFEVALEKLAKANNGLDNVSTKQLNNFFVKNADDISKLATNVSKVLKSIGNVLNTTSHITTGIKFMLNFIAYWNMFAEKQTVSNAVLSNYADSTDANYASTLKKFTETDELDIPGKFLKFIFANLGELLSAINPISNVMMLSANIGLLAWNLLAGFCPFFKENLASTDNFKLCETAIYYQNDARVLMNEYKNKVLKSSSISQGELEELADYTYAYLKFSLIARNSAQVSIDHMTNVSDASKKNYNDVAESKNGDIGMYLASIEKGKPNSSKDKKANYGFLPSDVNSVEWTTESIISFLEKNGTKVGTVTQEMEVIDEFTRTPGDGTISEEEAIQMVKDLMGGSMSTLIFEGILKDFYTFQVLDTPYIKSESTYAYIVTMELEGERDMYCLFVPVDGSELWIGWRVEDNIFCCYTEIDMKNVSITELITKMDELYQKEARGEEIPLEIVEVDPEKMIPYENGPAEVA